MDEYISAKALEMIDESAKNLKEGKMGNPINFNEFPEIIEEKE